MDTEKKQLELDKRYIRMASIWAENSYCQRRKVGALIVKDKMIISDGYNGTPSGFENVCEDENNLTKPYVLHAEANAITKDVYKRQIVNRKRASGENDSFNSRVFFRKLVIRNDFTIRIQFTYTAAYKLCCLRTEIKNYYFFLHINGWILNKLSCKSRKKYAIYINNEEKNKGDSQVYT